MRNGVQDKGIACTKESVVDGSRNRPLGGGTKEHWIVFKMYSQHFPSASLQATLVTQSGQGVREK